MQDVYHQQYGVRDVEFKVQGLGLRISALGV